uniref:Uncharacterized protein LOC109550204 isoform X2 n=1 Tax=Tursiops truncatus TaxID=9739 RepID=A0A6J3QBG7_TURTR|nr:uncharacterized protein LOC109550204 isoform X2 [Tursiops truncatus]
MEDQAKGYQVSASGLETASHLGTRSGTRRGRGGTLSDSRPLLLPGACVNISKYTREKDGTLHPAGEQGVRLTPGGHRSSHEPRPRTASGKSWISFLYGTRGAQWIKRRTPAAISRTSPPGEARRPCCTRCGLRRERTDSRYCPQVCSGPRARRGLGLEPPV